MNGVLIIDKPEGFTSHDVVARVRRILGERRVGHTGTLDPFATGVLVVLIGRATRLAQFLSGAEKEYEALIRLGYSTDTGDATGTPVKTQVHAKTPGNQSLRKEEIETAMASLTGEIEQTPPMYSAKKIAGRKLYEHARRGEEVERKPIPVTIHKFDLLPHDLELRRPNEDGATDFRVRVVCSAGTYVRTLAEDLGKKLGTGAHLAELRRTRAGRFSIADAITIEDLEKQTPGGETPEALISPNDALRHLPSIDVPHEDEARILNGIDLTTAAGTAAEWPDEQAVRLVAGGDLLAIGIYRHDGGLIHPQVVIKQKLAGVNRPS